jgi:copper chaperone CopZ
MIHIPFRRLALVALFPLAVVAGCASSADPAASDPALTQPIAAESATLEVHGMGCPLCAENVGRSLEKVPGVADAEVDLAAGKWAVDFEPDHAVAEADLQRAIKDAGFTLVSIEPRAAGVTP